jgi:FMN phosphatase YigB (HAD superfamily)
MNRSSIRAVIFDMGGTLEDIDCDDALRLEATGGLKRILGEKGLDKGYELERYFDAVVTSAAFGWRKPNPAIFLEAARQMQLSPGECAYVGDTVSRDVAGSRRSEYALAIQIKSFLTEKSDTEKDTEPPDAIITDLRQVSDIIAREWETDDVTR